MVIDSGLTIVEVAREIGVGEQLLGRWVATENLCGRVARVQVGPLLRCVLSDQRVQPGHRGQALR